MRSSEHDKILLYLPYFFMKCWEENTLPLSDGTPRTEGLSEDHISLHLVGKSSLALLVWLSY